MAVLTTGLCTRRDPVFGILDDVLLSCQNAITLESAHTLLRTLTSDPKLSGIIDTARLLEEVLEDIGFGGLWRSSTFHIVNGGDKRNTALTDRLIEVDSYTTLLVVLNC
jgi:neurofibromin 1